MKTASLIRCATAAAALAAACVLHSQAPSQPPAGTGGHEHEHGHEAMPTPKNLQVLPKTMTGEQVHELMHKWAAELGTDCGTCHATDPDHPGPNGRPRMDFSSDAKPEKATARTMVRMVEEINTQYIGKIDNSGVPVTCGTCHRGHITPEPFVLPPGYEHQHHGNAAPPPAPGH